MQLLTFLLYTAFGAGSPLLKNAMEYIAPDIKNLLKSEIIVNSHTESKEGPQLVREAFSEIDNALNDAMNQIHGIVIEKRRDDILSKVIRTSQTLPDRLQSFRAQDKRISGIVGKANDLRQILKSVKDTTDAEQIRNILGNAKYVVGEMNNAIRHEVWERKEINSDIRNALIFKLDEILSPEKKSPLLNSVDAVDMKRVSLLFEHLRFLRLHVWNNNVASALAVARVVEGTLSWIETEFI